MYRTTDRQQRISPARVLMPGLMVVLAASLGACTSSVKLEAEWSESATDVRGFSNVLVVGVSPDRNARCAFERALAAELRSDTVKATASCAVMAVDAKLSREAVVEVVKSTGADAVIATSLVAMKGGTKEGGSKEERGGGYYKPTAYGYDYGYYGVYGVPVVYTEFETFESVLSVSGVIKLSTNVYETRGAEKVYGMDTRAKNLESRGMALALITPQIAARLRDDGVIR
ncbi:MAG: hypothetical protein FJ170_05540 [Gammaproteobacteria bacterium]|nr:hypothetical protein [Gammaproteobacteria bacterium]